MRFWKASTVKTILIVGVSSCTLFLVILYLLFSLVLLNPSFYRRIIETEAVSSSLNHLSDSLSTDTFKFSEQSLKENTNSLIDGIIRSIKQNELTLPNISIETENVQALRSAVNTVSLDSIEEIPEISGIHPFVLTYFIPESGKFYSWLNATQDAFSTARMIAPVLGFITLFTLLLSKRTAENMRITFLTTGIGAIVVPLLVLFFQRPLLVTPLSGILPDASQFLLPFAWKALTLLCVFSALTGAVLCLAGMVVMLPGIRKVTVDYSRPFTMILVALICFCLVLFGNEIYAKPVQSMTKQYSHVSILSQGDGSVHSLVIKVREKGTDVPVSGVKLILNGTYTDGNDMSLTAQSDIHGNVRFILPEGEYLLFAEPSSVPDKLIPFEPVTLSLNMPDSSWYTLYFSRKDPMEIIRKTPGSVGSKYPGHPIPLLK
jgi:hypothetical protein